ncbi:sensor histidine kinase [Longimycelium tulufanense]|nr:histidine kinase [Longimycelium tulufanense]
MQADVAESEGVPGEDGAHARILARRVLVLRLVTAWGLVLLAVFAATLPLLALIKTDTSTAREIVLVVGLVGFTALYVRLLLRAMTSYGLVSARDPQLLLTLVLSLTVWAVAAWDGELIWLWVIVPAQAVGVAWCLLGSPQRWWQLLGMLSALAVIGLGVRILSGTGSAWGAPTEALIFVAGVSLGAPGQIWLWDIARELDRARTAEAELAAAKERLRLSADLHDVIGHTLEVIALKAELAARVPDHDQSRRVMTEVRATAHDALREVRELVRGQWRVGLVSELAGIRSLLDAAGIRCRISNIPTDLPADQQALLGAVLREAVTNMLRHSAARECAVDFAVEPGRLRCSIVNDGVGEHGRTSEGIGLRSMAKRMVRAGGRIDWGPEQGGRFRVRLELPTRGMRA